VKNFGYPRDAISVDGFSTGHDWFKAYLVTGKEFASHLVAVTVKTVASSHHPI
jgi:hypothetical protein